MTKRIKKQLPRLGGDQLQEFKEDQQTAKIEKIIALVKVPGTRLKNVRQEYFCRLWATDHEFFGNGIESYAEAYDIDLSNPRQYNVAGAASSRLLKNVRILTRINELIDAAGFNDEFADKQLLIAMMQNVDFGAKVKALTEYNKLKMRVSDKLKVEHTFTVADLLRGVTATPIIYERGSELDSGEDPA